MEKCGLILSPYPAFFFFSVVTPIIWLIGPNKPIQEGDNANLTCKIVRGLPEPQVTWLKNGEPLTKEKSTTLLLTDVTDEDEGSYTCRAENVAGIFNDSKYVTVESK